MSTEELSELEKFVKEKQITKEEIAELWLSYSRCKNEKEFISKTVKDYQQQFGTIGEFIENAIELQLIWWGDNPSQFNDKIKELTITDEQKDYAENVFSGGLNMVFQQKMGLGGIELDDVVKNIKKCYKKEIKKVNVPTVTKEDKEKYSADMTTGRMSFSYDHFPLLWQFYSRILPFKATLHMINYIIEKTEKEYFETTAGNMDMAFDGLIKIGEKIEEYDAKRNAKRNEKVSTGFYSRSKEDEIENLMDLKSAKKRFEVNNIGKRSKSDGTFGGALFALGLIFPIKDDGVTKIYISEKGYEFLQMKNPILDNLENLTDQTNSFSKDEVNFILEKLIGKDSELVLEDKIIREIRSAMHPSNDGKDVVLKSKEIDEIIDGVCNNWVDSLEHDDEKNQWQKDISKALREYSAREEEEYSEGETGKGTPTELEAWRMATMGRLSEMGIVKWEMTKTGSEYSKGEYFHDMELEIPA